jgi:DNA-binding PadR family transcriptional regulator
MNDGSREFCLALVRVHLLHCAAERPLCALAMIEELRRRGYDVGPATLYALLHSLAAAGHLTYERRAVEGKVRRYYRITGAGRDLLARLRPMIRELAAEVLEGEHDHAAPVGPAAMEDL